MLLGSLDGFVDLGFLPRTTPRQCLRRAMGPARYMRLHVSSGPPVASAQGGLRLATTRGSVLASNSQVLVDKAVHVVCTANLFYVGWCLDPPPACLP